MSSVRRFWRNWSIGSRLTGLSSLLVLVVVVALTSMTVYRERASFQQALEEEADLLLETLPQTMRDSLYKLEVDELMDVARVVSDNENVTLFIVYDQQGAVLVDADEPQPVFSQRPDPLGQALITAAKEQVQLDWQEEQLVAGRAVVLGNEPIGAVAIGLSTEPLERQIAALTRQSILLAVITLVLGGSLTILLAREITTPLAELANVASQMAGGDRDTRVTVQSSDELGQLGKAFNVMAAAIEKRETDLRELAAGLERTVQERTVELRAQNATLREANEALLIARRDAEAANRAKSAVLSTVSHEMRTPLTSILGFSRLIEKRLARVAKAPAMEREPRMRETVEQVQVNTAVIISEGERMLSMINNMLDLAKIESGKMEWDMRPTEVASVIDQSLAATATLLESKPLELVVEVEEKLPVVNGDRDRLIQVMVNLLSNAVKFTERGSITCQAKRNGDEIVVSVADTGIGINPRDYERVFEQFVQVGTPASSRDAPKGTGLGLPICKEIVEHHGGRIWVKSALGKGSTFYFTIPVAMDRGIR